MNVDRGLVLPRQHIMLRSVTAAISGLGGIPATGLRALVLTTLLATAGCASKNARFYTELTQAGSLTAGSPVVNLGSSIGSVASVSTLADGNAGVAFDVDRADADAIRRGSIMVLRDDPGGASLDVMNADPLSPPASPGTQIDGAPNQDAANSLVAAKNLAASAPAMAMMMSGSGYNSAALMNTSPAWLQMQQQILALQTQYLTAGVTGVGIAAQQLQQVNQNAAALERQLIAAGNSTQAEQLRRQVEALTHTLTTPPPGLMPPSGAGPIYGAPPAYGSAAPAPSAPGTLEIPPAR